ncbi:MAG: STAS domain-containing protein [candidate division Zixibacteria bacterium]|nr:STAS domain-containing protein [candidate division Zixibacteria bacterium]
MNDLKISLHESPNDGITEIRVDGVIDTLTATDLEEVIDSLLKRQRFKIVIDLAGIDYISSAGWGIFISHIRDVRSGGGDIKLAGMIPNVYEIYDLLEFDNVLKAYPSTDDARGDFGGSSPKGKPKKKVATVTDVKIIDQIASPRQPAPPASAPSSDTIDPGAADVETLTLRVIENDPFASIAEIRDEINRRGRALTASWWQVFGILRQKRLLTRRSRFRYFRSR